MDYIEISGISQPVSRIIFGCAIPPMQRGEAVDALIENALSLGVTTFDNARVYGGAESSLGGFIERSGRRGEMVIITKCCHYDLSTGAPRVSPGEIREDLERSLAELKTGYVDVLLLHRDVESVPVGPLVETLNDLADKGKVRTFGGSNWSCARLEAACEYAYKHGLRPFSLSSPYCGLAVMERDPWGGGCFGISGPGREADRQWYMKTGMPVLAYASLACGFLSGKRTAAEIWERRESLSAYGMGVFCSEENIGRLRRSEELAKKKSCTVAQLALAWTLSQPFKVCALCGSARAEGLADNLRALKIKLTRDELDYLG